MSLFEELVRVLQYCQAHLLVLLITSVAFYLVLSTSSSWARLRHVPGPKSASLSKYWLLSRTLSGRLHLHLKKAQDDYGDLVRIGPNELLASDVDVVRRMSGTRSSYTRGPWYSTFRLDPTQDHLFSTRDEAEHNALKTCLAPAFANTKAIEPVIDRQLARLIKLIDTRYLSTEQEYRPVDFAKISPIFTLDIIGDLTFGDPRGFGCLDEGEDVLGWIKWNEEFFGILTIVATLPWLTKILFKPPFIYLLPKDTDTQGLGRVLGLAKQAIQRQKSHDDAEGSQNRLGLLMSRGLSVDGAASHATLEAVAGSDSTATVIRLALLYIITSTTVHQKLMSELTDAIAQGRVSSPVKDAEARTLPYLQAVIKESMRIMPASPTLFFKQVPESGDTISGHRVPAGTQIAHNVYGIARSARYWGDDAEMFRPERWLDQSERTMERMSEVAEIVFGYGKYKCLGRSMAFMEMNKTLPELLRRYDFALVDPLKTMSMTTSAFVMMSGLWVRITKRETS